MAKTTLYDTHKKNGARIIDFAGWEMPVQFEGVIAEHNAVRNSAGIFDVSHMGEIEVIGKEAIKFCNWITTNNVEKLKENKAQYTIICNENGGVIDDVILYKFSDEHFLFCANASNTIKVNQWILDNSINYGVEIVDKSNQYSQFAVQGPNSIKILNKVFHYDLNDIPRFSFELLKFNNSSVIAARTGYTGEDGFELFITNAYAVELWNRIYDAGKIHGLKYCGLGSRDTLRIEMGYPLYGHEIDENISPLEAGLERYVKMDKADFIGKDKIDEQLRTGVYRKTVGFELVDRGIPRQGYKLFSDDHEVGYVTSGTLSPTLEKSIGIGLLNSDLNSIKDLGVEIRGQYRKAVLCDIPFYRK